MKKICPKCGTELLEKAGVFMCPNHGIIIDNKIVSEKEADYIG